MAIANKLENVVIVAEEKIPAFENKINQPINNLSK